MKGNYFLGNEAFELRELVLPALGDNDVLVRNHVCGVCGTDIHLFYGEPGSTQASPPVILGHEYAGIIEKVGDRVKGLKPGDKVTIDPNIYCGKCYYCRKGKKQMCEEMQGIGVNRDGGFAEYSVVPEAQAYILDNDLPLEMGAMAEPLACCIHGIDLANISVGESVLVIGGGFIGQLMVQLARLSGASHVILSEPSEVRRRAGAKYADVCIDPTAVDIKTRLQEILPNGAADVVIECVGLSVAVDQAFQCVGKGGTILLFSVPDAEAIYGLRLFDIFKKELTVKGSFVNPDSHGRGVDLLNSGKIDTTTFITHRFPMSELEEAIKCQMSGESIKVVVETY